MAASSGAPPGGPPCLPWQEWITDIDCGALSRLEKHRQALPRSGISTWLERIHLPMNACADDLRACLPESPLPIRSIFGATCAFLRIASELSTAKEDATEFALDTANWINHIIKIFSRSCSSPAALQSWEEFEPIVVLFQEIYDWANSIINEHGRMRRLRNGVKVAKDIQVFKERFEKAKRDLKIHLFVAHNIILENLTREVGDLNRKLEQQAVILARSSDTILAVSHENGRCVVVIKFSFPMHHAMPILGTVVLF